MHSVSRYSEVHELGHHVTFATAYVLKDMDGLTNIEVGAGLREWVDVISSQHLFSGKDKDTRINKLDLML